MVASRTGWFENGPLMFVDVPLNPWHPLTLAMGGPWPNMAHQAACGLLTLAKHEIRASHFTRWGRVPWACGSYSSLGRDQGFPWGAELAAFNHTHIYYNIYMGFSMVFRHIWDQIVLFSKQHALQMIAKPPQETASDLQRRWIDPRVSSKDADPWHGKWSAVLFPWY